MTEKEKTRMSQDEARASAFSAHAAAREADRAEGIALGPRCRTRRRHRSRRHPRSSRCELCRQGSHSDRWRKESFICRHRGTRLAVPMSSGASTAYGFPCLVTGELEAGEMRLLCEASPSSPDTR